LQWEARRQRGTKDDFISWSQDLPIVLYTTFRKSRVCGHEFVSVNVKRNGSRSLWTVVQLMLLYNLEFSSLLAVQGNLKVNHLLVWWCVQTCHPMFCRWAYVIFDSMLPEVHTRVTGGSLVVVQVYCVYSTILIKSRKKRKGHSRGVVCETWSKIYILYWFPLIITENFRHD